MTQVSRAARLDAILRRRFPSAEIEIVDDSANHAGHAGAAPGGETHFNVTIVAAEFGGMDRIARSRTVYHILTQEMQSGLHALALNLRAPGE